MKIQKEASKAELSRHFANSDELCKYMAELCGGTAILAFSRGKDSIVAWLKMRRYFKTIVPYFMYPIPPGPMSFEEESLRYYEDYFQTEIFRLPHPSIYGFWADGTFMSPETIPVIDLSLQSGHIFDMHYSDANDWIRDAMPEMAKAYQASGVRSADSQVRGTSIRKNGAVNHNKRTFFPIYDYKKEDMIRELTAAKIKLPVDYKWFGNTFDGIDYRFTEPLSRYSPVDFEQIKRAYPLVEADIMRMKYREDYYRENS